MTAGRGIFDRSIVGTVSTPVTVTVERDRVRAFAAVLGFADDVHHSVVAARAAGLPDLLAPPSFVAVIDALAEQQRSRQGLTRILDRLCGDLRYLLHGGETHEYFGPIFAGDDLDVVTEFKGFRDMKGGALEAAELTIRVSHVERGPVVAAHRTIIHRLPEAQV